MLNRELIPKKILVKLVQCESTWIRVKHRPTETNMMNLAPDLQKKIIYRSIGQSKFYVSVNDWLWSFCSVKI